MENRRVGNYSGQAFLSVGDKKIKSFLNANSEDSDKHLKMPKKLLNY